VPSPSQVNKAGSVLRKWFRGELDTEMDEHGVYFIDGRVLTAYDTLIEWRAMHSRPLVKANNGLRSMVKTEGCVVEVSQRLKRVPTIFNKLKREPTLALSRMQDIGGCRAVLESIAEIRRVQERLCQRRPPLAVSDYVTNRRDSGYRGVHVVVEYDGRAIEIQLRTRVMHEWAITVERLASRTDTFLKGDGDHPIQRLMKVIAEAMEIEETGGTVDDALFVEVARLRGVARPYLTN
jgi:putative GTP pyrophosphokinase